MDMKWYPCSYSGGTENRTVTFTQAEKRENIKSGEKHKTLFGKIARYFADLKTVAFTGSYSDLAGKPSSMPASDVHAWAKAASKPSYNWSEINNKPSAYPPAPHTHADYAPKANPVFTGILRSGRMVVSDNAEDGFNIAATTNTNMPCLRYRQFSNEFQVVPSTGNGTYGSLGTSDMKFANLYAKNVYNSSGMITSSDRDVKENFMEISSGFAKDIINGLSPVSFLYKDGTSGRRHYGLVAQDVEALLARLGINTKDFAPLIKDYPEKEIKNEGGSVRLEKDYTQKPYYSLRYEGFTGIIIKYIQCLEEENRQSREKAESLKKRVGALENIIKQRAV